ISVHTSGLWMMDLDHPINLFPVHQTNKHDLKIVKTTPEKIYFRSPETGIDNLALLSYEIVPGDTLYARRYLADYFPVKKADVDSVDPGLLYQFPEYNIMTSEIQLLTDAPTHIRSAIVSASGEQAVMTINDEKNRYKSFYDSALEKKDSVTRIAFYDFLESRQKSRDQRDSLHLGELDTTVTFQTPFSNMMSNRHLDSLFRTKTEIFTNLSFGNNEIRSVPESEFIFLDRTKI